MKLDGKIAAEVMTTGLDDTNLPSVCTCDPSTPSQQCLFCLVIARTHDLIIANIAAAYPKWCPWICNDCEVPRFTKNQMEKHCVEMHKRKREEVIYRANPLMDEVVRSLALSCMRMQPFDKLDEDIAFYYKMLFSQSSVLYPPLSQPSTDFSRPIFSTAPREMSLWNKNSSDLNKDLTKNAVVDEMGESDNSNSFGSSLAFILNQQPPFSPASMTTSPSADVFVQSVSQRDKTKSLTEISMVKHKKKDPETVKKPTKKEKKICRRFTCKKCFASVVHDHLKMHCYHHLYRDENLILFSCTFPGCDYTHYTALAISLHLLNFHHSTKIYEVKNSITDEIEQRAMELVDQYFYGDNKELTEDDSESIAMDVNVDKEHEEEEIGIVYIDSDSD